MIEHDVERDSGLPLRWYDVLLELNAAPEGRLRMLELGEVVVLSRTRVSRVVDELVAAGLVVRIPNPGDGRSAFASITASGRRAFRRAAPLYLASIRAHLKDRIGPRDASTLRRIFDAALRE